MILFNINCGTLITTLFHIYYLCKSTKNIFITKTQQTMNLFKAIFGGGKEISQEEKKREEEKKQFDILKYDGIRAMKAGQTEYAIKCLDHALTLCDDLECHDYLWQAYFHQGNMTEAYQQLHILADAQPDNDKILLQMAHVCYLMEDYVAMSEVCEKVLLIDDTNTLARYFYALACNAQGDTSNAIAMLTKCITLNPDYFDAHLLRGDIYRKAGNLQEAKDDVSWLLENTGGSEDVFLLAARTASAENDYTNAEKHYSQVIELNPFHIDALRERASVRKELGDVQGGTEDLQLVDELKSRVEAS